MQIEVREPCHENWQKMTPQEKGRHCDKCCKTVFDFTEMPTDLVIKYIAERKNENICGRFRNDQVVTPKELKVTKSVSDRVKRFLAALIVVFGAALFNGCDDSVQGKLVNNDSVIQTMGVPAPDSTHSDFTDTIPAKKDTVVPIQNTLKGKVKCVSNPDENIIQGGPMIAPEHEIPMGKPSINEADTTLQPAEFKQDDHQIIRQGTVMLIPHVEVQVIPFVPNDSIK